ncbi:acyl-CoA dehydrogenase family protein [Mumia qirimensis]|uniref:acyl-CoA dehydrogenase family protein n=1 Tax=Mumia qirimensis TaxID=3234852 RepID=UPI00351D836F
MKRTWASEARDLQSAVRASLAGLGGVELARAAEEKAAVRVEQLRPALESLGILDLDPWGEEVESSAAVLAVRACGEVVAPYPVARVLSVPAAMRSDVDALYVVDGDTGFLEHADLFDHAIAVDANGGGVRRASATSAAVRAPLDPFGTAVALASGDGAGGVAVTESAVLMSYVLDAFWVAGALQTVATDAARYATQRRQFGKAIATFGEIRWRLADIAVAVDGLDEMATFTWFQVRRDRASVADALAVRLAMLEAAGSVLRNAHQVFGAIGLCEEHDLTVVDRHLTPTLIRPFGQGRTLALLVEAIDRSGFSGTFDVASRDGSIPTI